MATTRKPKLDTIIRGTRVRVYASRSEYEVVFGNDDVADPDAYVMCYPKIGDAFAWADQGVLDYQRSQQGRPNNGGNKP